MKINLGNYQLGSSELKKHNQALYKILGGIYQYRLKLRDYIQFFLNFEYYNPCLRDLDFRKERGSYFVNCLRVMLGRQY